MGQEASEPRVEALGARFQSRGGLCLLEAPGNPAPRKRPRLAFNLVIHNPEQTGAHSPNLEDRGAARWLLTEEECDESTFHVHPGRLRRRRLLAPHAECRYQGETARPRRAAPGPRG